MSRDNKKYQPPKMLEKDIHLNLNPDISESIKEYQDSVKAERKAKESLEKHKHLLEQD